ncbi:MAG: dockerin type I repeat-containing protein, partial [Bacteroidaceae bacterium]|nr:dockerin type I repeat-containing protein [Bacteroidaceae bacterium]
EDGTVTFSCECAGEEVVQGSEGPVATFKVAVGDVEPGDYAVSVKNESFVIKDGPVELVAPDAGDPYTWTIEAGAAYELGDVNCDGAIDVSDVVAVLAAMADPSYQYYSTADVNGDGAVDISDAVKVLSLMAGGSGE